jgi:PAS domain S-box-containing protein
MRNRSAIQPDTLHADTQGQSEPVFGLCRMLGIKLMPRMRGLSDAVFYRPTKSILYRHIDVLFGGEIDWDLIATHARDMTVGVAETDCDGRFVLVNDRFCAIVGRSTEELLRLRMQDITHPDDLQLDVPLFDRLVGDGAPFEIEKRYLRPDGTPVWVHNSVSALADQHGRPTHGLSIALEIHLTVRLPDVAGGDVYCPPRTCRCRSPAWAARPYPRWNARNAAMRRADATRGMPPPF